MILGLLVIIAALSVPATASGSTTHDLRGNWQCCGPGGAAAQEFNITSMNLSSGSFSGNGSGGSFTFPISGTADGNSVTFTTGPYNELPSYSATFTGTICAGTNQMSGTWSDTGGAGGTWSAGRTSATQGCGQPVVGETAKAKAVKGEVLVDLGRGGGFVPLDQARSIPVGAVLDTTKGTVKLTTARNKAGKLQSGKFGGGVFKVAQSHKRKAKGLTELRLKGSAAEFKTCGRGASASALSKRTVRKLRANAKGRFRTRGRHSAATVRGTKWTMEDRCDGTLTTVKRGTVAVRDFGLRKTIVVKAGKSYLAAARG